MKREKSQDQERILAEHLDELKRSNFCHFDKPRKRAYQKGKIESIEQSKEGGQPKILFRRDGFCFSFCAMKDLLSCLFFFASLIVLFP